MEKVRAAISMLLLLTPLATLMPAHADSAQEIDRKVDVALNKLYARIPAAKTLAPKATGILVFPDIIKAGLGIGGQYGEGALRKKGTTEAYYQNRGISKGIQIGAQHYGYAMFFMSEDALKQLDRMDGWEVGVGPSVVVVDEGMAKMMTTTTLDKEIYAFIFGQKGLMAGVGIQGNKITRIEKH